MRLRKWWWGVAAWSLMGCGAPTETAAPGATSASEEAIAQACAPAQAHEVTTLMPPDRQRGPSVNEEPRPESLTNVQGTLYFMMEEPSGDATLWKSDGSATGTLELARLPSSSRAAPDRRMTNFTAVGAKLFLQVFEQDTGWELWASDGTPNGTRLMGDLTPGGDSSNLSELAPLNGHLSFVRRAHGGTGVELWRSDGTPSGTYRVRDFAAASALTLGPTLQGGSQPFTEKRLFFIQEARENRLRLWRTDGTAVGTRPVQSFAADASVVHTQEKDGAMLFFVREPATGRIRLWRTDGTLTGTTPLRDLGAGAAVIHPLTLDGDLLFFVHEPGLNSLRLWRTDGTAHGTHELKLLDASGGAYVGGHHLLGGTAILRVVRPGSGTEFWRTDGTPEGTTRVGAFEASGTLLGITGTAVVWLQPLPDRRRLQIWRMPLATGRHERVAAITNPYEAMEGAPVSIQRLATAGGKFYVTQEVGAPSGPAIIDVRLWVTDGTEAGTRELSTELSMSDEYHSVLFDTGAGRLLFSTRSGIAITDGTAEGTVPVTSSSSNLPGYADAFLRVGDTLYFRALAGKPGYTLWRYPVGATCGSLAR